MKVQAYAIIVLFSIWLITAALGWFQYFKIRKYFKKRYPKEWSESHTSFVLGRYDETWFLDRFIKTHAHLYDDAILIGKMKVLKLQRLIFFLIFIILIMLIVTYAK